MTLAFISNFMNHHQKPIADRLYALLGDDYRWIATTPVDQDRIKLGYDDYNSSLPYVLRTYAGEEERRQAVQFCSTCDCLIVAYDFDNLIAKRMKNDKMTVVTSERVCKNNAWDLLKPKEYLSTLFHFTRYRNKPLYFLSIGEYAARDYKMTFSFPGKCFRWGYFVDVLSGPDMRISYSKTEPQKVFWAARFIDWKHPEYMLYAAEKLKREGLSFVMEMAGTGPLYSSIQERIKAEHLDDCVKLLGAINHESVREKMLQSPVFCLTSNRKEGWGAVVGEALASKCITVSSNAVGAASMLLKDGINGVLFHDNDPKDFTQKLRNVLKASEEYALMAENGYDVMNNMWNPDVASKRLVRWIDAMLTGEETPFETGPCSFIR